MPSRSRKSRFSAGARCPKGKASMELPGRPSAVGFAVIKQKNGSDADDRARENTKDEQKTEKRDGGVWPPQRNFGRDQSPAYWFFRKVRTFVKVGFRAGPNSTGDCCLRGGTWIPSFINSPLNARKAPSEDWPDSFSGIEVFGFQLDYRWTGLHHGRLFFFYFFTPPPN